MSRRHATWNDVKGRGFLLAVGIAAVSSLIGWGIATHLMAKIPGETHCYKDVCHRVFSLDETRALVGQTADIVATHYDVPGVDKFNTGQYTSSGEEFDASNPARTSASNYPDGTELLVWHPVSKKAAHVRVNDFGPFWGKRTLDVTRRVAEDLGFAKDGVANLKVTVIWVPPPTEPRYRKGRVYPPSLGLLGVVESTQHAALVQRLVASAHKRNGYKGPIAPAEDAEPPSFHPEPLEVAKATDEQLERDVTMIVAGLPRLPLDLRLPADLEPPVLISGPPNFRSEGAADAPAVAAALTIALADQLQLSPAPALPTEPPLTTPSVLALAPPPSEHSEPQVAVADVAQPATVSVENAASNQPEVAGSPISNQPTVAFSLPTGDHSSPEGVVVAGVTPPSQAAMPEAEAPSPSMTVAMARAVGDVGMVASPFVWIGIALMLTTLWGANALSKSRKARATPGPVLADETASDALDAVRRARDIVESEARAVLARETAQGPARSEAEADAREALARELAQRETDREAQMRARLEQARAEQEAAARELAEIEAARASRQVRAEPVRQTAEQVRDARVRQAAAAEATRLERDAMDRAARDARLATMPSNLSRDLAAAVLGLPGSERFWGNVIIAQARVEGVVKSGSALRIDGIIDGACQAPILMISQGAVITGTVAAETIVVLGTVRGTLIGRNVTIAETAQVEGDMFYQTMSLDQNAQCDLRFSRLPKDAEPSALGEVVHQARHSKAA